jgi:hypothetical protein
VIYPKRASGGKIECIVAENVLMEYTGNYQKLKIANKKAGKKVNKAWG